MMSFGTCVLFAVIISFYAERETVKGIGKLWLFLIPCSLIISLLAKGDMAFLICCIWGFETVAFIYDIKYMEVNDFNHYVPMFAILCMFLLKLTDGYKLPVGLYYYIPILFVLLTIRTRGFSDTLALFVYTLYGIIAGQDALVIIVSILIGYTIQILIAFIESRVRHEKFNEKKPRPFLPALYVGSLFMIVI